ncbi:hypothetical protein SAMN06265346_108221 [Flavobacterium hercynium]|nr:hypothetical protein SAMN06265346_108221 [Flavobacterium hercynium]
MTLEFLEFCGRYVSVFKPFFTRFEEIKHYKIIHYNVLYAYQLTRQASEKSEAFLVFFLLINKHLHYLLIQIDF